MTFTRTAFSYGLLIIFSLASGIGSGPVLAESLDPIITNKVVRHKPKEAKAMLDDAVAYLGTHAPEQAFKEFNDPKSRFVKGDLYVFVVSMDGVMRAHGGSPQALVNKDVTGLEDASGKLIIREILKAAKLVGAGMVDYVWRNPATNKIEDKSTQFKRVGEYVVAVGSYVPRSSAEHAKEFLDIALDEIQKRGEDRAFRNFNDPKGHFVSDDLYVFVIGVDDMRFYAMGATPSLVGTDASNMRDAEGNPIIREMVRLAKEKGSATYNYMWRNPADNAIEDKHSLIQLVDKYVVGVGYYTK